MDVSTHIRPNTKNFIEGYDLLRTFLSETKSRFASDSIEDICYDGKNCKLKLCQECDLSCDSLEGIFMRFLYRFFGLLPLDDSYDKSVSKCLMR